MNELEQIVSLVSKFHLALYVLLGYFAFSNAVGALPVPDDKSSVGYRYIFAFLHGFAGNIKYAASKIAPTFIKVDDSHRE